MRILIAFFLLTTCGPVGPFTTSPIGPDTRPLSAEPAAVSETKLADLPSMTVESLLDGRQSRIEISRFGNGIRAREEGGCTWTKTYDWFAPSDSFANCGGSGSWRTARAKVRREGNLFPLRTGARASYLRKATSGTGKTSTRRTDCEVIGAVEVLRPDTSTPAYVVVCGDGRITRTTWYSPGLGPIAYTEEHNQKGMRDAWVRVE